MSIPPEQHPQHNHRRIGGLMIGLCWIVVIGIVTLLFSGLLDDTHNPNTRLETTSRNGEAQVRLRQNRMGHYVATGTLNGQPAVFLLDTGATTVSVPEGLARDLALTKGKAVQSHTANGTVTTYLTRIDEVRLGAIVMRDVLANINPGMRGHEVLLGMSFLRHLDFRQSDGTLTLMGAGRAK
ncbi:MAG: aspartyl protease family protein [Gammaproteobacteria bacterium]|jgi:aspartyl protease family protein